MNPSIDHAINARLDLALMLGLAVLFVAMSWALNHWFGEGQ